ncbi:uncharacterized protein LOC115629192 [Scaptodrosophila lebanonensis]|uniref:5-hydroxyisourate hydrolase n=1 Tax=Drosophila lebanonensis TaxID=7225 RepID=A0A6J2U0N1_DROLE|nr:uncharacterized protein LOC115629192 [Scaptodrosophila lebanonensis]
MNTRRGLSLSTHVLDTSLGTAAANLKVTVHRFDDESQKWQAVRAKQTDPDGRCNVFEQSEFPSATYKLTFHVGAYYVGKNLKTLYPAIEILVDCTDDQHYHLPLLLSPYGYTTYRGS